MSNPFFQNLGPFKIYDLLSTLNLEVKDINGNEEIFDIKDLSSSKKGDITFFHSKKYKSIAEKTNASFCITTKNLKINLPNKCIPIVVENVLVAVSKLTSKFYPYSIYDNFDDTVSIYKI